MITTMFGGVAAQELGPDNTTRCDTDIIAIQTRAEIDVRLNILVS
jgi:hypothetical protein